MEGILKWLTAARKEVCYHYCLFAVTLQLMLTVNLNAAWGLYNGFVGTVLDFRI